MNEAEEDDAPPWDPEEDAPLWTTRVIFFLSMRGVDGDAADRYAEEAVAHCAETGEGLDEAFGSAKEYAERMAYAHAPAAERAKADTHYHLTVDDYWGYPLMVPGFGLMVTPVVLWVLGDTWIDVTVAGLAGGILVGIGMAIGGSVHTLRAAGHPRAGAVAVCVALAMGVPAALAALRLPGTDLARIPTVLFIPVGLLLCWLGYRMKRPKTPGRIVSAYQRRRVDRIRAASEESGRDPDVEEWLDRLEGLLRGRRRVERGEARRLVTEARAHLTETGARPQDEFGDVEVYALSLAEEGAAERSYRERRVFTPGLFLAAMVVLFFVLLYDGGYGWLTYLPLVAAGGSGVAGWTGSSSADVEQARPVQDQGRADTVRGRLTSGWSTFQHWLTRRKRPRR
ncbi:MAG TPA: hypothetical protein VGO89_06385 [Streptomyces sp.]|jgi:hypothetical protein|nr:hypothetical protein [Streptomyces sp.]